MLLSDKHFYSKNTFDISSCEEILHLPYKKSRKINLTLIFFILCQIHAFIMCTPITKVSEKYKTKPPIPLFRNIYYVRKQPKKSHSIWKKTKPFSSNCYKTS